MFLIGTVFVVGSAVLMGVNRLRDLLDERLPKPQPSDDDQPLRLRIKDWSAWRQDSSAKPAPETTKPAPAATEPKRRDDRG